VQTVFFFHSKLSDIFRLTLNETSVKIPKYQWVIFLARRSEKHAASEEMYFYASYEKISGTTKRIFGLKTEVSGKFIKPKLSVQENKVSGKILHRKKLIFMQF
jgi:hypothetical protein